MPNYSYCFNEALSPDAMGPRGKSAVGIAAVVVRSIVFHYSQIVGFMWPNSQYFARFKGAFLAENNDKFRRRWRWFASGSATTSAIMLWWLSAYQEWHLNCLCGRFMRWGSTAENCIREDRIFPGWTVVYAQLKVDTTERDIRAPPKLYVIAKYRKLSSLSFQ